MATNSIDKGLYAAPLGIEEDMDMAPIEIEIEDPEGVRIAMGGIEIELEPGKEKTDMFSTFKPASKIYGGTAHHRSFKSSASTMTLGRMI